ncbi:MAG TPA: ABC transporter permease [Vicinamibacterales bacterium]
MTRLLSLLRNLFRRDRVERELDEEMRAMLDVLVADHVRSGMSPREARRAAGIALGIESTKTQVREARRGATLDSFLRDAGHAVRLLWANPVFTAIAALSVAIGIGTETTAFTIANGLLRFAPPGVADPARLVDIGQALDIPVGMNPASYPDYLDIRRRTKTLDHVYAHPLFPVTVNLATKDSNEDVLGDIVTTNYFAALGARAAAGRLFLPDESDQLGATPVVVLSHRYWIRRFGGSRDIVGQTVRVNRYPVTVIGVAPEGFHGNTVIGVDLWVPMSVATFVSRATPETLDARNGGWVVLGARLKPGVSRAQASQDLDAIERALREEYPDKRYGRGLRVLSASPLADKSPLAAAAVLLLGAIASIVLTIACANIAGLLLIRGAGRRREMAMRLAIGAGRGRLVRQLLTETAVLFVLGAAGGVALARVLSTLSVSVLSTLPIAIQLSVALDWRALLFAGGLALLAALVAGLTPALHASKVDVSTVLKDEAQGSSPRFRTRLVFVVAQLALSFLLIAVGGLFARALSQASSASSGFDSRDVEVASLDTTSGGFTNVTGLIFARDVVTRVRELPGVAAVSIARVLPYASEGFGFGLSLPGAVPAAGQPSDIGGSGNIVEPGYFSAMRIPFIAGRDFTNQDTAGTPLVAIVDEVAARRFWPDRNPIGQQIVMNGAGETGTVMQVIGVVREVPYRSLSFGSVPFLYLPLRQHYSPQMMLIVRATSGSRVGESIRTAVAAMNAQMPAIGVRPLDEIIATNLLPQRLVAVVAGGLGIGGILLAAIGIYGVTAYSVTQRTREIAIRAALGAGRGQLVRLVLKQGVWLTSVGLVVGLILAGIAGQVLSLLLVGVSPVDPLTFLVSIALCGTVSLAACYVPVHRALRVAAAHALRAE